MFTDFDREIAPDKPDLVKLVEVAGRHGAKIRRPGAETIRFRQFD